MSPRFPRRRCPSWSATPSTTGRAWIYRGTDRRLVPGYAYFLANAGLGLIATVGLFAALLELGLHYLLARIVASIFVGLMLFVLNATVNFRSL